MEDYALAKDDAEVNDERLARRPRISDAGCAAIHSCLVGYLRWRSSTDNAFVLTASAEAIRLVRRVRYVATAGRSKWCSSKVDRGRTDFRARSVLTRLPAYGYLVPLMMAAASLAVLPAKAGRPP